MRSDKFANTQIPKNMSDYNQTFQHRAIESSFLSPPAQTGSNRRQMLECAGLRSTNMVKFRISQFLWVFFLMRKV